MCMDPTSTSSTEDYAHLYLLYSIAAHFSKLNRVSKAFYYIYTFICSQSFFNYIYKGPSSLEEESKKKNNKLIPEEEDTEKPELNIMQSLKHGDNKKNSFVDFKITNNGAGYAKEIFVVIFTIIR